MAQALPRILSFPNRRVRLIIDKPLNTAPEQWFDCNLSQRLRKKRSPIGFSSISMRWQQKRAGFPIPMDGTYPNNLLKDYFTLDHHAPYWITVDEEHAGFVLVRAYPDDPSLMEIGQFFVANAHVRKGVGAAAFRLALAAHPGNWQIRVLPDNQRAVRFWEKNIRQPVGNDFTCEIASYQSKNMQFYRFQSL